MMAASLAKAGPWHQWRPPRRKGPGGRSGGPEGGTARQAAGQRSDSISSITGCTGSSALVTSATI